ncbi:MAG: hypothetical protein DMNBKLKJ_00044 [Candidatus Westeberhardia cardiocondylae]|nr:hypothetical protein [Candidatus Westeberhardia cardiocondylae]
MWVFFWIVLLYNIIIMLCILVLCVFEYYGFVNIVNMMFYGLCGDVYIVV